MVFSDPVFLFVFMPLVFLCYWSLFWRARNIFLVVIGAVFYMWGGGSFILLLLASITINHFAAVRIFAMKQHRPRLARSIRNLVVVLNLSTLATWKYGNFVSGQVSGLLENIGAGGGFNLNLALPIAISFFTFQSISYIVDVHRGDARPAGSLTDYAAYILLFPHLIAGPIVRYSHIEVDLVTRPASRLTDFADGAPRFFWGLAKKVIVADQVAAIANQAFSLPNSQVTTAVAWLGAIAYAVQIYFDFSGYSDMAIGLARMFGFRFPENFDHPYSARSITDFWRRWHISLSTWFRDYVYIPLGGNRGSAMKTLRNLSIVFLLTGIWHGANWTFLAWGVFHGSLLVIERYTGLSKDGGRLLIPIRRGLTFAFVCLGWTIFRAVDISQAGQFLTSMITPQGLDLPLTVTEVLTRQRLTWFAVGCLVLLLPSRVRIGKSISESESTPARALRVAVVLVVAPLAALYALTSSFSPFLYFQF